jgi:hypothetical protein
MYLFMSQPSVGRGRGALCQRTSISSILLCRLGDGGIMGKLAAWAEAGADDAMLARREKDIFGLHMHIRDNKSAKQGIANKQIMCISNYRPADSRTRVRPRGAPHDGRRV